jgi:hypothetical protein
MRRLAFVTCLAATTAPAAAADLTLHRVMLSAAGVGYFGFDANIEGPTALGLDVPLSDVDDVLRSLAIFDDHGGIGSIELPGRDNTHEAFADVPFTAETLNDPADLLASLRGEEIVVTGPDAMTGRIVGTEPERLLSPPIGTDPSEQPTPATHTRVTLLTADGLQQFVLQDATSVQLTDPALRARVGAALDAARQQSAASSRHLTLRTTGDGARQVSVGYVVAVPLWKASYRLVLPAANADHARIQGWAVLENQSGQDWKAVDLTLHAGNPVTFHQAIYASYYANRPEVPVEVLGRILPTPDERSESVMVRAQKQLEGGRFRNADRAGVAGDEPPPQGAPMQAPPPPPQSFAPMVGPQSDLVALAAPATQAQATETAIDTSFHIATPIDLARGHTASVPILDQSMPAEPLDWLQATETRPISAVRLKNTGAESLPAGVLTLYTDDPASGPAFAGDARLAGLPAGETRLLGFAQDLRTTATRTQTTAPRHLLKLTAAHGILHRTLRERTIDTVTLTGPAHQPRRVLVEFPKEDGATFTIEGPSLPNQEQTATAWRVLVPLAPNETRKITADIDTISTVDENILLNTGDLDGYTLTQITADTDLDPALRAQLQPLFTLRDDVSAKQNALTRLTDQQTAASTDEERIRNNLQVVTTPGNLHEKLLTALDADETRLATLRTSIAQAQTALDAARGALSDAVEKLAF